MRDLVGTRSVASRLSEAGGLGKRSNVAITAIARELVGLLWDVRNRVAYCVKPHSHIRIGKGQVAESRAGTLGEKSFTIVSCVRSQIGSPSDACHHQIAMPRAGV